MCKVWVKIEKNQSFKNCSVCGAGNDVGVVKIGSEIFSTSIPMCKDCRKAIAKGLREE